MSSLLQCNGAWNAFSQLTELSSPAVHLLSGAGFDFADDPSLAQVTVAKQRTMFQTQVRRDPSEWSECWCGQRVFA